MSKPVSRLSSSLLAAFFVIVSPAPVSLAAQPKNVILFIGDGMGFEHVKAARFYNGGNLSFESLANQGQVTTYSANNTVTDSAAAATAIATGLKVNNDVISVALPGDGRDLETMLELFKKRGKATGLITTAYLTHATPAGFGAHDPSRNNTTAIGNDLMSQTQPNILFGGGGNGLDPFTANSYGYQVATDTWTFNSLSTSTLNLCALFGTGYMAYEEDYLTGTYPSPHLTDMVVKALDALEGAPDGFFLMVEAGRIDHAAHSNLLPEAVHETLELSRAVQAALNWISTDPDTLLIVTADHETGGLQVLDTTGTAGFYPSVKWTSTGHTAANVPVYATGPGANFVPGTMDNTHFLRLVTIEGATQPFLYRVSVQDLTDTTATIVWNTDEACNSLVEIRPFGAPAWTQFPDAALTTTHEFALVGLIPGTTYEYRVSSSNSSGSTTTSDIYTFKPIYDPSAPLTLIPQGSMWKYHDDGIDLGTSWRDRVYTAEASWQEGLAELGYGDGGEKTILSYGTNANLKYPTYYFRRTFTVADPAAYGPLSLTLLRDDGAIVYLNGTEVHRVNMPAGTVGYTTYASSATDYSWDAPVTINNLLVAGENVLAVEVHQGNATSSDLSFDLKLEAVDANNVQIVKGPWLQKVTPTSIVVMWETDGPVGSRVDYGVGSADEAQAEDTTPVQIHEVTLTDLLPNTSYRYTVASGYAVSTEATFQTAPATEDESFRFVVYSDTQVPAGHHAVVNSIMANNPLPRFVLHAGDLTDYGRTYSYWDTTFFTPAAAMLRQIPVYPALGNHEYAGTEQMWYFDFFNLPDNGTTVGAEEWYAFTYGSVRVIALNSSASFASGSDQYNWLVTELASLASQSARWRVVFFHHPPFPEQTVGLEAYLVPLFHQYGVHLVFSGHNHCYRHVYRQPTIQDRVDYIITGGGGATLGTPLVSADPNVTTVAAQPAYHHCVIDVSPGSLLFKAVDNSGFVIDSFTFYDVADTASPVITAAAAVNVTDTTATITWTTDENANSVVQYTNMNTGEMFEVSNADFTAAHSILLTGLTSSTAYDYRVISSDPAENLGESSLLTFTTKAPNIAPVAAAQTIALDEDTLAYITLGAADSNLDPLTYRIFVYPANGTLAGDPPSVSYTPNANYSGPDSFQFVANDGTVDSAPATISITINAIPDDPTAPTGLTATAGDGSVTLNWGPGSDVDGDALTYRVYRDGIAVEPDVLETSYKDSVLVNGMTYRYTVRTVDATTSTSPPSNEVLSTPMSPDYTAYAIANPTLTSGTVTGDYTATRQTGDGASQTLTELKVGLNGYLDAVYTLHTIATPSTISSLTLRLKASYSNFTDPLKVYVQLNGVWTDITVDILADDAYTPSRATDCIDASGNILVRFTDSVANRREKLDTLSIDQLVADIVVGGSPVNHPPIASDDAVSTTVDTPITIDVLANDTEPDNDVVTITAVTQPANGSATLTAGSITYLPNNTYSGPDSFTYTLTDEHGAADTASVNVTVTAAGNNFVHVGGDIQMSLALAGKSWKATARVTVVDQNSQPVPGATVTGNWFFNDNLIQIGATAVTDASGVAASTSAPVKASSGTFAFRVTNITLSGYDYVPPTPAPEGTISISSF